ncbi:hypothetical protein, partial [Plasmodium yoelii yoelii]
PKGQHKNIQVLNLYNLEKRK